MPLFETTVADARFAIRSLRRTPIVTAAAVLSIALGIAATTSVFSIVDAALFRPPPFDEPNELVVPYTTRQPVSGALARQRWSWRRFRRLRETARSFVNVASFSPSSLAITGDDAQPVNVEVVSSTYFATLHVSPIVGRTFDATEDDVPHSIALIGYDLWQRRFGGDRSVLGRTIEINGVPVSVVGVVPDGFHGLTGRAELWLPPTMPARLSYRDYQTTNQNFISVVARLRPGVSVQAAQNELALLGPAVERELPSRASASGDRFSATAMSLSDARIDPSTRTPMLLLLAASACLLALACANVAGLLLGRALSRRREIAIRLATGANRARVARQLLVEAAMVAGVGGAVGVLVAIPASGGFALPRAAWRGRNYYGALSEFAVPRVDVRVLTFAAVVCALTTIVFGLVPAMRATRLSLASSLKDGGGAGLHTTLNRVFDARRLVVAVETALAIVLLVGGGLLGASWRRLAATDLGFDRSRLLTFLIAPSDALYPASRAPALIARVVAAIEALPAVVAATVDGCAPVGTGCANSTLYVMGRPVPRPEDAPPVLRHYIGPNHFRTLGVPLVRGRFFDDRDRGGANRVAIINQLAAQRFWPNEDPIGKRVWFGGGSNFDRPDSSAEIVGIVGNVAYQALDERPFQPDFYTPFAQFTYASRLVLVRTRVDPMSALPEVRRALHDVDPTLALFDVRTMDDLLGDSWSRLSYQTRILAAFAFIALFIAAMGIFAVIAHAITDRRREIGIRSALGASPVQILAAVGAHGARPAAVGLVVGLVVSLGVGRILSSVVFGVRATDPLVLTTVALLVTAVVVLASCLAARRALAVDPAEPLKGA